jgi:RNA polymerase subunit RPABC4/transcription elongation factor Spt4
MLEEEVALTTSWLGTVIVTTVPSSILNRKVSISNELVLLSQQSFKFVDGI